MSANSTLVGLSLSEAEVRDRTGSLALALHDPSAGIVSDAGGGVVMKSERTLIAIGTPIQPESLATIAGSRPPSS